MDLPAWAENELTKAQQVWLRDQSENTKWVRCGDRIVACWTDRKPITVGLDGEPTTVEFAPISFPLAITYYTAASETIEWAIPGDVSRW